MKRAIAAVVGVLIAVIVVIVVIDTMQLKGNQPQPAALGDRKEAKEVGDEKIAPWVIQLGDPDVQKRTAAAEEIKKIGKPALPYLQRAVNSVSENVRKELLPLIQALGGVPPVSLDEKLAALVIQLGDPDAGKRAAAADEIKKIGKPALFYLERAFKAVGEDVRAQLSPLIEALGGQAPQVEQTAKKQPAVPAVEPVTEPDLPEPKKYRLGTKETIIHIARPSAIDIDLVYSPDGKRMSYVRQQAGGMMGGQGNKGIVIDNVESPEYVGVSPALFSPDSKRVAYTVATGRYQFLLVDGAPGKFYEWIGEFRFSPDSQTVAFGAELEGKQFVVVDKEEGKRYKAIRSAPVFSPDGKSVAYAAKSEDKEFVVVDSREGQDFEWIDTIVFGPDSKRVAYIGANRGRKIVVVDGEGGKEYDEVSNLVFSPDARKVAYLAQHGKKQFVVENNKEGNLYEKITMSSYFSPDGKHTVFSGTKGDKTYLVLDGEEKEMPYNAVAKNTPIFSPDGKRVAFAAMRDNKYFMVVDGVESRPYDGVGSMPVFSPNSRHCAFLASLDKKWRVVVDGLETLEFERFPKGAKVVFSSSRKLHVIILRNGNEFRLLEIELVPDDEPEEAGEPKKLDTPKKD